MSHYNSAKLCAVIKREKEKEGKRHRREGTKYSERERKTKYLRCTQARKTYRFDILAPK